MENETSESTLEYPTLETPNPETEATAEVADNEPVAAEPVDVDALIAEAEQRGYMRGVNEQLSREFNRPDLYADLARSRSQAPAPALNPGEQLTSGFLANIRRGVWD